MDSYNLSQLRQRVTRNLRVSFSSWPQLNSGNDDRTSLNTEPAVYLGNVSQQSHLSLMHPLPETSDFSPNYGQSVDEHILDIIP